MATMGYQPNPDPRWVDGGWCSRFISRPGVRCLAGPRRNLEGAAVDTREQFEEVLSLQEIALEAEGAEDDLAPSGYDERIWGFAGWCRWTE